MQFDEIYKTYWQKVFRMCMGYVNDFEWAQDIAQETFIIVWKQLPNFRNESNIGTWIFKIASNNCLKQIEKEKRMVKTELPINLKEENQESIEPQLLLLCKFISELAEIDRLIISLELEEIKQVEIANIIGISEANVRVKIHRIKEKLMKKFKENGQQ
ncbi:MAG: sigma-70 family RNA polymerase sigma factor [Chitinophagaceae bacterium]|nr:sigma-70 family RNA polymerase sigma factor [Chitinophagaceae bacterium]